MLSEIIRSNLMPHEIVSLIQILNPQDDGFDFPISLYHYLDGEQVKEMYLFGDGSDKKKTEQLACLLGDFLTKFHNIKLGRIKDVPIAEKHTEESIKKNYFKNYEKYKKDIFPIMNYEEQRWVTDLHESFFKIVEKIKIQVALCHGDFDDSNTLISQSFDRLQIIDLEEACIGDPIIDFCVWVNNGEDFVKKMLKYYRRNIDECFWERILFYNKRLPLVYFAMGVEQNNKKFIEYGRKYLKQKMKIK